MSLRKRSPEYRRIFHSGFLMGSVASCILMLLVVPVAAGIDHYLDKKKAERAAQEAKAAASSNAGTLTIGTISSGTTITIPRGTYSNGYTIHENFPQEGEVLELPPRSYISAFSDGVEFQTQTLRMIRRNEKKLGRPLTDEEYEGIIDTRISDSRVVAMIKEPL